MSSDSIDAPSVVAGPVSRAIRAVAPSACTVNSSDSAVPTARSVSLPAWPSRTSKPSPCSAVSSPLPSRTVSSPAPAWTVSLPSPAAIVSGAGPPRTVSAPGPDSIVTCSVSGSAMRTMSSPPPERISMFEIASRSNVKSLTASVVAEGARTVI